MTFELLSLGEIAADIGKNMRLARAARGLRQEDLAASSGASLQAIKNLEGGGKVEFMTFLRVAKALNLDKDIWSSCLPKPKSLDELSRIESARAEHTRVRVARAKAAQ
jgi:transcriptional regulator with XRE-family HTH domain